MEMRGHHLKPSSGISWLANQYILASVIDLQSDRVYKIELLHSVCAARVWSTDLSAFRARGLDIRCSSESLTALARTGRRLSQPPPTDRSSRRHCREQSRYH